MDRPVVLFDGVCNFCDHSVHFILDHERDHELRFAALQSEAGKELLERLLGAEHARDFTSADGDPTSVLLVEGDRVLSHSTAALGIARHLRFPWSLARAFVIVPRFVRDAFYRWFARNRYKWFGKSDACRVPTPELRARFL